MVCVFDVPSVTTRQRCTVFVVPDRPGHAPSIERIGEALAGAQYRPTTWNRGERYACCILTLSGVGRIADAAGNHLATVGPGQVFCFRSDRDRFVYRRSGGRIWRSLYVNITGSAADEVIGMTQARHGPVWPFAEATGLTRRLERRLPEADYEQVLLDAEASITLAQQILDCVLTSSRVLAVGGDRQVEDGMTRMLAELAEPPSVAQVATGLGLSREHFSRRFQRVTGQSPAAWLRDQRLRLARDLLAGSHRPVAAIARACGFKTSSAFCKAYRGWSGRSPVQDRAVADWL